MARQYRPRVTHALPILVDGDLPGYQRIEDAVVRARRPLYAPQNDAVFLTPAQAEVVAAGLNFNGGPRVGLLHVPLAEEERGVAWRRSWS